MSARDGHNLPAKRFGGGLGKLCSRRHARPATAWRERAGWHVHLSPGHGRLGAPPLSGHTSASAPAGRNLGVHCPATGAADMHNTTIRAGADGLDAYRMSVVHKSTRSAWDARLNKLCMPVRPHRIGPVPRGVPPRAPPTRLQTPPRPPAPPARRQTPPRPRVAPARLQGPPRPRAPPTPLQGPPRPPAPPTRPSKSTPGPRATTPRTSVAHAPDGAGPDPATNRPFLRPASARAPAPAPRRGDVSHCGRAIGRIGGDRVGRVGDKVGIGLHCGKKWGRVGHAWSCIAEPGWQGSSHPATRVQISPRTHEKP